MAGRNATGRERRRTMVAALSGAAMVAALGLAGMAMGPDAEAAAGCSAAYKVTSEWPGGFVAGVDITNLGDPVSGWTLGWRFADAGQQVTSAWGATTTQSGAAVTATNVAYDGSIGTRGTVSFGFQGTTTGSNPIPTSFALNGTTCTGATTTTPPVTTPAVTTPPVTTPPVTTPATPPTGVHGFATANGSTTGGAGGSTVTVTSLSAFKTAAAGSAPEVIKVSGNFASTGSEVTVASNKTIIGVGSGSGLTGIGLSIKGVSNVIVRNLKISKVLASSGNGDSIHIEKSNHVWIDHNDLSSDTSHGTDYYDGQLDITHAADYITVSYNYIHDHIKCSLVGHSDSNASEDTGHLHVTYDHNYFRNCDQRTPSLRFGTGHVYDNYFDGASTGSTGIHSRMGAQMLVQNNVFRNVKVPIETTKDSDVDGFVNQTGNDFGGGSNLITQTGSFTNPPYSYALDPTTSVINLVTANAGTGMVG